MATTGLPLPALARNAVGIPATPVRMSKPASFSSPWSSALLFSSRKPTSANPQICSAVSR
jgi:hypothetical protein